jgi:hypothetical protein
MKKQFVALLAAGAMYAAITSAASATTFMSDWKLNLAGTGSGGAVVINEYLDTLGNSYIKNTVTGTSVAFNEVGFFESIIHDGAGLNSPTFSNFLTATFAGSGSGTLNGNITFNPGGFLKMYSDTINNYGSTTANYGANDGTLIASFKIKDGNGTIDPSGIPNGQITVSLVADFVKTGYFFDKNNVDLATYLTTTPFLLGFATTNASAMQNPITTPNLISELAQFAGIPVSDITNQAPGNLVVSDNGQYRLQAVPEPGTMALFGLGMFGLAIFGKRRMNKEV